MTRANSHSPIPRFGNGQRPTSRFLSIRWLILATCVLAITPARAEFSRHRGKHLELITDLDDPRRADDLVASFDAAVPQWAAFWQLRPAAVRGWQVVAYVMQDPERFRRAGHIPDRLPDFRFGYALGDRVWVIAQPSDYYTRHLLLHEGVHSLAFSQFGGAGPTWFMEGTAEFLSTHVGAGETIRLGAVPASRQAVPYWGRFKLMSDRREQGQIPSLQTVMRLAPQASGDPEAYGWSWAAAMLLHHYPDTWPAFRAAARHGRDNSATFTRRLYQRLQSRWPLVVARWRIHAHDLDYGFDWERERVDLSMGDPLWDARPLDFTVQADQGWQSPGVRFAAGTKLTIAAEGRCVVAETSKPWVSEPPGVTIRYHRGRPLGQLLVAEVPCHTPDRPTLPPLSVRGYEEARSWQTEEDCWLLFRVNDDVGELADNRDGYDVRVRAARP